MSEEPIPEQRGRHRMNPEITSTRWEDDRGRTWTRQDFTAKVQWEGGYEGMVMWGGPSVFPPELRKMAEAIDEAFSL